MRSPYNDGILNGWLSAITRMLREYEDKTLPLENKSHEVQGVFILVQQEIDPLLGFLSCQINVRTSESADSK